VDTEEAEQDRQWQNIVERWRTDEAAIVSPQGTLNRVLKALESHQRPLITTGHASAFAMGVALLAIVFAAWLALVPEDLPEVTQPAGLAQRDLWAPFAPCGESSTCLNIHAKLERIDLPSSGGT
jgi:hypothetical protein